MGTLSASDIRILRELVRILSTGQGGSLGPLAETLAALRDALEFDDGPWFQRFTHDVTTIDSASTFVAKDPTEERQAHDAVLLAILNLRRLLEEKLRSA